MMFISVDLPDPDWPTMATNSPRSMGKWMSRSAGTLERPRSYVFTMWSSSISAMSSPAVASGSATAALRALVPGPLAGLLRLDLLSLLQLARERAVRPVHHRLALRHPAEDLHVGAAGDARLHLAHLRHAVLVHHEHHLHRLRLAGRRLGGRIVRRAVGPTGATAAR